MNTTERQLPGTRLIELLEKRDLLRDIRDDHSSGIICRWRVNSRIRKIQREIDAILHRMAEARAKADREQASV